MSESQLVAEGAGSGESSFTPWWVRPGLEIGDGRLTIAGADAAELARKYGTPVYVYDLARFAENAREVQTALAASGLPHLVRFALKANREPEVLRVLRELGAQGSPDAIGIDACSPGEVVHAIASGWLPEEISFTGTNVSDRDFETVLGAGRDGSVVHVNLDAVSQVERFGRLAPGSTIGLRVDPRSGAGYNAGLLYSGERPTKFGIGPDRMADALAAARRHDLTIDTVHFHAGSGWLADDLPAFERALVQVVEMTSELVDAGCPIREVNVGGGLGRPAREEEAAVDVDAYGRLLSKHLGPLGVTVACEPGDFIAKDAAILLGEVVTVERRADTVFVGLDLGWNVNCGWWPYRFLQEIVVCRDPSGARTERVTVVGHINEAADVFAEEYLMPRVEEGDIVAILNAGGYFQAMSSTHCLRPQAPAVFLSR